MSINEMDDIDDLFWASALKGDVGKDRRWIIPDKDDLDPPESINSGENDAMLLYSLQRQPSSNVANISGQPIIVRILEERGRGVWDAVGGEVWEASLLLSMWLRWELPSFHQNGVQHIMEVGCGVALPSLYLSQYRTSLPTDHNSFDFTLTDHDSCLMKNLYANLVDSRLSEHGSIAESDSLSSTATESVGHHIHIGKLDWTLFNDSTSNDDYDALLPSTLNRHAFDILYGSALCYAPCHKCLAYLIRYYLSGRCQEVIVIQIGDREGFQDMVHTLKVMGIPFTMETISESIYNEACHVQVRNVASTANLTANAASSDAVQKYVEYSLPSCSDQDFYTRASEEWNEAPRVITTDREAFTLLRVYRPSPHGDPW